MREIRYLDKLVDALAKGKPMEKILRKERGALVLRVKGYDLSRLPPPA
ncbi:DUF2200 family protein [Paracoccus sp. pheM1]|nr:DUF2200 family protein [Paracoccus sp. pheM1]